MRNYFVLLCVVSALWSCSDSNVRIKGRFPCCVGKIVYLDMVSPGKQQIVDSVKLDDKGEFKIKVSLPQGMPTIYNLRSNDEFIPLLLSKGDRLSVNSMTGLARNYEVEGSEGSKLMQQINTILSSGAAKLDSLSKLFVEESNEETKKALLKEYSQTYYGIKRDHIQFVVGNCSSVAAIYGLYQRLPNDEVLFNGDTDVVYYRMVADSVSAKLPQSPYVVSLLKQIADYDNRMDVMDLLNNTLNSSDTDTFPELNIADMYGNKVQLSSLKGKTIIVDFWSAAVPACKLNNAEYRELYANYKSRGLEIYQVGVDNSKSLWVNAVQDQKLPWITVSDFMGTASPAVKAYNVSSVPTNFIISPEGEIVARSVYGDKLSARLAQMLK